jgi:hypothetical protein
VAGVTSDVKSSSGCTTMQATRSQTARLVRGVVMVYLQCIYGVYTNIHVHNTLFCQFDNAIICVMLRP